ncbi:peptidoglycan recognition protein family protein [Streptococcus panodentis]|uniref:N-acetylmuramoyl-L-alanine amidase n=1 Tax=Streptococcus panodentis TaxID=1581472 RepID=A0ABS5AX06_9STRE|nr:peptidoglycan recognition family protein [Streptococcus panodentis]MBP2621113.1 BlyA [Streptococcus panodentis]
MALPTKNINGDIFSGLITDVDPNVMNADGNRVSVDYIVIHHNATTNDAVARGTWYVGGAAGTSAHYQVTPDRLWGCVGENMVAYHAGNYPMNQRSIGIEHLNETGAPTWTIAEATYQRSAALIADICQRYGIPIDRQHIIKHGEVSATACPGGIDIDRLVRMAQQIANGGGATPANAPRQQEEQKKVGQKDMLVMRSKSGKQGYVGIIGDSAFGIGSIETVQELQKAGAGHASLPDADFERVIAAVNLDTAKLQEIAKGLNLK